MPRISSSDTINKRKSGQKKSVYYKESTPSRRPVKWNESILIVGTRTIGDFEKQ
jgi:hypothetical protein